MNTNTMRKKVAAYVECYGIQHDTYKLQHSFVDEVAVFDASVPVYKRYHACACITLPNNRRYVSLLLNKLIRFYFKGCPL